MVQIFISSPKSSENHCHLRLSISVTDFLVVDVKVIVKLASVPAFLVAGSVIQTYVSGR